MLIAEKSSLYKLLDLETEDLGLSENVDNLTLMDQINAVLDRIFVMLEKKESPSELAPCGSLKALNVGTLEFFGNYETLEY